MRSWRAELRVSAVFSHSRDKSSCEERIWEIWESCQEQRIRNMWKTTAQLRYHYGDCNTGLILVNSINSRLLAPRYLHFFTSKIPVSALCSYAQTNISPYLDLARLCPEQIEIFIWAYLHTAYAQIWGGGGDAGRVATLSDDSYDRYLWIRFDDDFFVPTWGRVKQQRRQCLESGKVQGSPRINKRCQILIYWAPVQLKQQFKLKDLRCNKLQGLSCSSFD